MRLFGAALLVSALLVSCNRDEITPVDAGPVDVGPVGPPAIAALEGSLDPLVLSVWAAAPDDVWLVGGEQGGNGGLVAHYDGRTIVREEVPVGPVLWWVFGTDAAHVWAVGQGGRILARKNGRWTQESTGLPASAVLWGIWGASPSELWAVGGSLDQAGPKGIVLRSSGGGTWIQVHDPALPVDRNLFKVWGGSVADVHIVGDMGTAIHFTENGYQRVDAPTRDLLFTVHGRFRGEVFAVGGLARGLVFRWSGTEWLPESIPDSTALAGLYALPDGTAIAGGGAGVLLRRSTSGVWTTLGDAEATGLLDHTIHGISAEYDVWAVGGRLFKGKDGLIATNRRPLPELALTPAPPLPDAGPMDARRDAGVDAGRDAGFPDAGFGDAAEPDATDEDVAVAADAQDLDGAASPDTGPAGPGQHCEGTCAEGTSLECLAIAPAGYTPICTRPCMTPVECADFPAPVCCIIPGPQTIQTYCVPTGVLDAGGACP